MTRNSSTAPPRRWVYCWAYSGNWLSTTLARIQNADAIERLQSLPAYLDTDIGRRTLESYKPAVPVTMEGILYAGGGFILGYLVLSGLWRFLALPFRRRRYAAYR